MCSPFSERWNCLCCRSIRRFTVTGVVFSLSSLKTKCSTSWKTIAASVDRLSWKDCLQGQRSALLSSFIVQAPTGLPSLIQVSTGDHQDLQEGEATSDITAPEPLLSHSANEHKNRATGVPDPDQLWKVQIFTVASEKAVSPQSPCPQVRLDVCPGGGSCGQGKR